MLEVLVGRVLNSNEIILTFKDSDVFVRYYVNQDKLEGTICSSKIDLAYLISENTMKTYTKNQKVMDYYNIILEYAVLYTGL